MLDLSAQGVTLKEWKYHKEGLQMTYDLGYVLVFMMMSCAFGFSVAYGLYQEKLQKEYQRGKAAGYASQRDTARS